MIFNNFEVFKDYINEMTAEECENITVIMRTGYSMNDLLDSTYDIELLQYEAGEYVWLNDWYEGQVYIEVYDWYKESELLHKLMHLQHREGLEDYVD